MTWEDALEVVIARTGHQPYRKLCADEHPKHEKWRRIMIEKATGKAPEDYPPLATQVMNAAKALGRVVSAVARGEPVYVSTEERNRRRAICSGCEHHDPAQNRCRKCGCRGLKLDLATEKCPLPRPKW
jgi:hypothetical protein